MIATIAKHFTFDAAHFLPLVPADHKCHRMHGHTYEVEIIVTGPIVNGFVVDYEDIATAWAQISDLVDHRVLNEIPGLENPSTENLIAWMFQRIMLGWDQSLDTLRNNLSAIRIKESSTTWCEISARNWLAGRR